MTVEKMITELNKEELTKVYSANRKLREGIQSDMYDSEMDYINEMLHEFKNSLSDYSISSYGYTYIKVDVDSYSEFIEGIKSANESYGMLPDQDYKFIEEVEKKVNKLNTMDMYSDEYDNFFSEVELDIEELAEKINKTFKDILEYTYNEENGISYLIEFYAHERIENTYIVVDENGNTDYILNEDITKTYN